MAAAVRLTNCRPSERGRPDRGRWPFDCRRSERGDTTWRHYPASGSGACRGPRERLPSAAGCRSWPRRAAGPQEPPCRRRTHRVSCIVSSPVFEVTDTHPKDVRNVDFSDDYVMPADDKQTNMGAWHGWRCYDSAFNLGFALWSAGLATAFQDGRFRDQQHPSRMEKLGQAPALQRLKPTATFHIPAEIIHVSPSSAFPPGIVFLAVNRPYSPRRRRTSV